MSSFQDISPAYNDPSVTDDIKNLAETASQIQQSLYDARAGISVVDSVADTKHLPNLVALDEKYEKLLQESRKSASTVRTTIGYLIDVVVPIALNIQIPLDKRIASLESAATAIIDAAKINLILYDTEVANIKNDLELLHKALTETHKHVKIKTQQPLIAFLKIIDKLAIDLCAKKEVYDRLTSKNKELLLPFVGPNNKKPDEKTTTPVIDDNKNNTVLSLLFGHYQPLLDIYDAIKRELEKPAKLQQLDIKIEQFLNGRQEVVETSAQIDHVLAEMSTLINRFSGIVGKIGHFGVIWDKIVSDTSKLRDHMTDSNGEVVERIQSELDIYVSIQEALKEYCLHV